MPCTHFSVSGFTYAFSITRCLHLHKAADGGTWWTVACLQSCPQGGCCLEVQMLEAMDAAVPQSRLFEVWSPAGLQHRGPCRAAAASGHG